MSNGEQGSGKITLLPKEHIIPEHHTDYQSLMALAKELVTTGFLPQAIKTPAQAVAIILTGQELGLPPMKALRLINVIQGKPCLAAELQLALFKQRGGSARWLESTDQRAVIKLVHPNGDVHEETFTIEDATRAGLTAKGGNWKTYPKIMLRWRAASNGLKAIAPDILSGVYDPDEMGAVVDMQNGEIVEVPAQAIPTTNPTPQPRLTHLPETWTKEGKKHPLAGKEITNLSLDELTTILEGLRGGEPGMAKHKKDQPLLDVLEGELDLRITQQRALTFAVE